ncbi:MAG TPA: hypothetical protein VNO26_03945 [Candidatus Limnocylindria bacterium]|nr:hypothetical protein [Candidatus Limnocylindria bacterium]
MLGTADFRGVVVVLSLARERVRTWLPDHPDVQPLAGCDRRGQPAVILFGEQAHGETHLAGVRIPLGRSYRELAVAVPLADGEAGREPRTALLCMYADYFPAVWNGRMRYGFGKQLADIHRTPSAFVVARPHGGPLCMAVHDPAGPWSAGTPAPLLRAVAGWLSGTLVGRTPAGRRVHSDSHWGLDGCRARPVRVSVRAFEALVGDLGPGELIDETAAAFEVDGVRWSLGWPERNP